MKIVLDYQVPTTTVGDLFPGDIYALCTHFNDVLLQTQARPTLFMRCFDAKIQGRDYFSICLDNGLHTTHSPEKIVRKMYGTLTVSVQDKPEPEEE